MIVIHDMNTSLLLRLVIRHLASVRRGRRACSRPTLGIEAHRRLLPIEIKANGRPRLADTVHLRTFRAEYGKKARAGLLLHTGTMMEWIAPDVLAAPWWRVV
jgi:hypothetical protein